MFNQIAEGKYGVNIFGIHQAIYGALTTRTPQQYFNRKSENFENINFLPILYKSVTKILKKCEPSMNAISIGFTKVNVIINNN